MKVKLHDSWKTRLDQEFSSPYFQKLAEFVKSQYQNELIYPHPKDIFKALDLCPFEAVKVVILGQDPYHGPGQANGLAFSVNDNMPLPPSLLNIYKELQSDLGKPITKSGNLDAWANQGVLLLNATLTVRAHQAGSHQNQGWEMFTDAVIRALSEERENLVFILWGNYAQKKGAIINKQQHLILTSAHPSPLSALQWIFWLPPLFQNQYLPHAPRSGTNRLVS
jgi:uracil-DNA glycosylase